jgi:hypothetical protein
MAAGLAAHAETVGFDRDSAGNPPAGWICGSTDGGAPLWEVEPDDSSPSKPNVLVQSGSGTFPWCVKQDTAIADGVVEVKFKALAGSDDQAAGLLWRWKDGDNYYVARADSLDNNVSLSCIKQGKRRTLKSVDARVEKDVWHTLRVEFTGSRMRIGLDGQTHIDVKDDRITGPGAVGVWTSADSVTAFDDFTYRSEP